MELETRGTELEHGWEDADGFVGPLRPGGGPRSDPRGDFPTGPELGERLPDIVAVDARGKTLDVHRHRDGRPAAVVFFRSAVW